MAPSKRHSSLLLLTFILNHDLIIKNYNYNYNLDNFRTNFCYLELFCYKFKIMKNLPTNSKDSSNIRLGDTDMFKFLYNSWR